MSKIRQRSMYSYQLRDNSQELIGTNSHSTLLQRRNNIVERKDLYRYRDHDVVENFSKIEEVHSIFNKIILHILEKC